MAWRSMGQVAQQRHRFGGEAHDLLIALFIRPEQVEHDVAHTGGMELADAFRYLVRSAECAIALRGAAEVHRVAHAERFGRRIECLLVAVVDAGEQQVAGAEPLSASAPAPRRRSSPARRDTSRA